MESTWNGINLHQISHGNNAQDETFSPDGRWIAFTAYPDTANKDQASCEIYIMDADGTDLRRLTQNSIVITNPDEDRKFVIYTSANSRGKVD